MGGEKGQHGNRLRPSEEADDASPGQPRSSTPEGRKPMME